jgi:alpha-galactosidase
VAANAQLWRISDDVWDRWDRPANEHFPQGVKNQFAVIATWVPSVKPGNWPDADMLPLGTLGPVPGWGSPRKTRLTQEEQRTLVTLWAIARSPLIVGANLTELDDWTAELLTNADVVAMDQHGSEQKVAEQEGNLVVWTSKGEGGRSYLALFNVGESEIHLESPLARYGLERGSYAARDIWKKQSLGKIDRVNGTIAPHGVMLMELR